MRRWRIAISILAFTVLMSAQMALSENLDDTIYYLLYYVGHSIPPFIRNEAPCITSAANCCFDHRCVVAPKLCSQERQTSASGTSVIVFRALAGISPICRVVARP